MELHECIPKKPIKSGYGSAVDFVFESEDGELWAENGEYGTQINFCPFCGHEAKKKVEV